MTNEKAIKMLEYIKLVGNGESEYKNDAQAIAIDMAIKALEQQPCEDCISRQEALSYKHIVYDDDGIGYSVVRADVIAKLPSVTPKAEQKAVLGKIRAEIEQITDTMGVSYNQYVSKIDVLQIINKYKAESEVV